MPYCPRCKQQLPDDFFQQPVSICLPCYSTSRGNNDLSLEQLRHKAINARIGKYKATEARRASVAKMLLLGNHPALSQNITEDDDIGLCDKCMKPLKISELPNDSTSCPACRERN